MAREINPMCDFIFSSICTCLLTDTIDVELTIRTVKGIYTYHKDHTMESMIFLPWSKTVIPFPSLRWKIQAYKNEARQVNITWNNDTMPPFSTSQKLPQNPRKHASGKIKTGWFRCNHRFNPVKTNRCNTLDTDPTAMNKINIIQPIPKRTYNCPVDTCTYCKYKAPCPSPIPSEWLSEDWDGEKAKKREQRLLIDLNFQNSDQKQMMDLDILKELSIQNVDTQEDGREEQKTLEVTDSLVLPLEVEDVMLTIEKMEKTEEKE